MFEDMFFVNIEHVGMGWCPPPPKKNKKTNKQTNRTTRKHYYFYWKGRKTSSSRGNSARFPPKNIPVTSAGVYLNWWSWILVPYPGRNRFYRFSVTIPPFYKDSILHGFFHCTAKLWNFLSVGFLPLNCFIYIYLNCFKSRFNRHLLSYGFFNQFSYVPFILVFFFL